MWECGCCCHSINFLQRLQVFQRNRDNSVGPLFLIYFPPWGGMFCGPLSGETATGEDYYYMSERSSDEKDKVLHEASLAFADNSRKGRGRGRGRSVHSRTLPSNATSPENV
ncbi:hypothetical protein V6N11_011656 [Hibiscus sabdariffa]|uniref:Uncharacterized protein n=1 Tax=Hibiscus sabdariffa TaxID=183260 RepID=A0ABR2S958_9ROSI